MKINFYGYFCLMMVFTAIVLLLFVDVYAEYLVMWSTALITHFGYTVPISTPIIDMLSLSSQLSVFTYIFVIIISIINYRIIRAPSWKLVLLVVFLVLILNSFIEHIWLRKGVFFLLFLPLVICFSSQAHYYFKTKTQDKVSKRVLLLFNTIFWSILLIPGFYLPPFFDGIAGWTLSKNPQEYEVTDIRIKFDDSHYEWFRASFFNPLTMNGRSFGMIKRRDREFFYSSEFSCFLHGLYTNAYPSLKDGKLPTQSKLGKFAYSPHTFDSFPDTARYLPIHRIRSYQLVKIVKKEGIKEENILHEWESNIKNCEK